MLKVWPGTEKDPSGLDNVSEALVLVSLLTTGGKVGMGQWHRLQPQGYSGHGEERHGAKMVGGIISICSVPRTVSVGGSQGGRARGEEL